jgi:hypothetical protein
MKRSMIAVCLLFSLPSTVIACYEDHNAGPSWFEQQSLHWSGYGIAGQSMQMDKLMDVALAAGGTGALVLLGVVVRAMIRAARRAPVSPAQPVEATPLGLLFDGPACEPMCARPEADFAAICWSPSEFEDVHAVTAPWGAGTIDSPCSFN